MIVGVTKRKRLVFWREEVVFLKRKPRSGMSMRMGTPATVSDSWDETIPPSTTVAALGTMSSVSIWRVVVGGRVPGSAARKEETCCWMFRRRKSSAEMLGLMVRDVSADTSSKLVVGVWLGPTKVVVW